MQKNWNKSSKIRPLIKWTGGKYDEFPLFSRYIPDFKSYYEPFFGGGGVFFALQPKSKSFLNDKSRDLIRFYNQISSPGFKDELYKYATAWEKAGSLSQFLIPRVNPMFSSFIDSRIDQIDLEKRISGLMEKLTILDYFPLFDEGFCISAHDIKKAFAASLFDKFKRIKRISIKEKRHFNPVELTDHIETGVKSGLYLYIRSIMNDCALNRLKLGDAKETANWYFVRELCYGSMFRFNKKGEFNIPYGGIAYNAKNLQQKVDAIFAPHVQKLFSNCTLSEMDFEDFFTTFKPGKGDFVFLDPPYDSEFSKYDNNSFTRDDQIRLRNVMKNVAGKWMLVIKETKFIRSIYEEIGSNIIYFDKTYTYNVRGRNSRDAKHLIITNYLLE